MFKNSPPAWKKFACFILPSLRPAGEPPALQATAAAACCSNSTRSFAGHKALRFAQEEVSFQPSSSSSPLKSPCLPNFLQRQTKGGKLRPPVLTNTNQIRFLPSVFAGFCQLNALTHARGVGLGVVVVSKSHFNFPELLLSTASSSSLRISSSFL